MVRRRPVQGVGTVERVQWTPSRGGGNGEMGYAATSTGPKGLTGWWWAAPGARNGRSTGNSTHTRTCGTARRSVGSARLPSCTPQTCPAHAPAVGPGWGLAHAPAAAPIRRACRTRRQQARWPSPPHAPGVLKGKSGPAPQKSGARTRWWPATLAVEVDVVIQQHAPPRRRCL